MGAKASLVESQHMSSIVLISFNRLSFCIHFLSCSFMLHLFPFILHWFPFILLSCPFMFRRYVSKIQVFENWYAQSGRVCICPNRRVFSYHVIVFVCRLAIVLEACAGCHLQASWRCTCTSLLSFFFTLIALRAGNALAVLRCKPS